MDQREAQFFTVVDAICYRLKRWGYKPPVEEEWFQVPRRQEQKQRRKARQRRLPTIPSKEKAMMERARVVADLCQTSLETVNQCEAQKTGLGGSSEENLVCDADGNLEAPRGSPR
ncbi:hypothetical protein NDU88_004499 [Pleurodeles waltl]|uniref:Uncharacterized protein n=1 Tax=Pleurodeles waltl TaxID=8319 RepID=A0AAV7WVZ5_PLEWA|nr:hypothetical protein NDU88_004499 [Pleurodeles waltl]